MSVADHGAETQHESWVGDVTAGVGRAVLRLRHTLRTTRVPALKAARNLDRLSTAVDATDVARGVAEESGGSLRHLYERRGGVATLRSIALPFASAAVSGTALFAVYEEAVARSQDRLGTHVAAGAAGGIAFATTSGVLNLLSALGTGSSSRAARLLAARLPRACVTDGAEWAAAFGVYDATKRYLLDVSAAAPVAGDEHAEVPGSQVAAVAAAGAAAGLSQSAVAQLVQTGRLSLRSAIRAAPASAVGFAAWELGRAIPQGGS